MNTYERKAAWLESKMRQAIADAARYGKLYREAKYRQHRLQWYIGLRKEIVRAVNAALAAQREQGK